MESKINIAVIGCGYWGKNLIRNFSELGCLYCVCDDDENLAREFSKTYSVKALNLNQIIENKDIHGVAIAVPAKHHYETTVKVIESRKHVFVEKPLALNIDEAEEMAFLAKKYEVQLMVGHLLQYHPAFIKLKKLIDEDSIGSIKYIYSNRRSFGKVRSDENVLWSFAPHDISMVLSLLDSMPVKVKANSFNFLDQNNEDMVNLDLYFNDNVSANISVSWVHPFKDHCLTVMGSNGSIVFNDTNDWNKKLLLLKSSIEKNRNNIELIKKDEEYIKIDELEPLQEECKHFINIIQDTNLSARTDGYEGLRVMNILKLAEKSLQNKFKDK